MAVSHICNAFFEKELEERAVRPLLDWFHAHPTFLQLQFLPLLYAGGKDHILVTSLPEKPDPRLCLIASPPSQGRLETWAPSLAIAKWASSHHLSYEMPEWELVRMLQAKTFSFSKAKLPQAELLSNPAEVASWIDKTAGQKVLKAV